MGCGCGSASQLICSGLEKSKGRAGQEDDFQGQPMQGTRPPGKEVWTHVDPTLLILSEPDYSVRDQTTVDAVNLPLFCCFYSCWEWLEMIPGGIGSSL